MKAVSEYREFAAMCRDLAGRLKDAKDRKAVEVMASGWDKVADDRETRMATVEAEIARR
jgi:hypothetical protein